MTAVAVWSGTAGSPTCHLSLASHVSNAQFTRSTFPDFLGVSKVLLWCVLYFVHLCIFACFKATIRAGYLAWRVLFRVHILSSAVAECISVSEQIKWWWRWWWSLTIPTITALYHTRQKASQTLISTHYKCLTVPVCAVLPFCVSPPQQVLAEPATPRSCLPDSMTSVTYQQYNNTHSPSAFV